MHKSKPGYREYHHHQFLLPQPHLKEKNFSRLAAKTLIWLLVFQPVYVAMGMELGPSTPAQVETPTPLNTETTPSIESDVSFEPEQASEDDVVLSESATSDDTTQNEDASEAVDPEGETLETPEEETDNSSSVETTEEGSETYSNITDDADTDVEEQQSIDDTAEENLEADVTDVDDSTDEPPQDVSGENGGGSSGGGSANDSSTEETDDFEDSTDTPEDTTGGEEGDVDDATANSSDEAGDTGSDDTVASSSDEVAQEGSEEVDSTTTEEGEVVSVNTIEGSYVFNDGDCTVVADGEFYCVKKDVERLMQGDQRVYSKQDSEGDREIYYFDGMDEHRVTNNSYDDFAPVFEEDTLRIVWQAMINDRLQVMYHELPSNTTRQVTTARENSSNPHIADDTLVWQQWVGTNWEIMMSDVDNDGGPFDIEQLTDNAVHDMFPQAYDDVITWQRERGSSWQIIVYDKRTGKETALEKNEGTKYENPRFVLLFDSKHENGDIETIGYDLDTGEMMELGTKGRNVPEEPKTPRDETQDAIPREATSTAQLKPVKEDDDPGLDF